MKNKVICTMLIIMLIITPTYKVYAEAGTITIAGGTIAVGGLSGAALAGLAGPAVVAVFVSMMAVGVNIELTKQSEQAGMTKTQFLKSKIEQYCNEANITADVFYKGITNGASVLRDGSIAFTDSAAGQIKQFINWLFNTDQVIDNTATNEGTVNLGGINAPLLSQGETIYLRGMEAQANNNANLYVNSIQSEGEIAVIAVALSQDTANQGKYFYWLVSNTSGTLYGTLTDNGYVVSNNSAYRFGSTSINGYYRTLIGNRSGVDINSDIPVYIGYNTSIDNLLRSFNGEWESNMSSAGTSDGFTGTRDEWNQRSNVFDPSQGWPTVVNPGLVGQIPIPADTDVTVNIKDYLEALQKVLDKLQDISIVATDKSDGIPKDYDIPDATEADPSIGKQPPTPADERTPVSNDDPVNPATDPAAASEPLKFDLRNIFPFCIPFDIKDILTLLSAEPVAPQYHVDWHIPIVNTDLEFDIDLSCWNDVATIARKMELLSFIVGLALITRNLIRG